MAARLPYHTIGHSTLTVDELAERLQAAQVTRLIDVRTLPRSRTNPQFNRDALPEALAPHGIAYQHLASLGGRRSRQRNVAPEVNGFWDNRSFHNYADYATTPAFRAGLAELMAWEEGRPAAVVCAEAVWWRCHRRIIADYLMAAGCTVFHLLGEGAVKPAEMTPGVVARGDGALLYPAAAEPAP